MHGCENQKLGFKHKDGVTYFTKRTERRVLFVLTMVMLLWGIVEYAREIF